MLSKNKLFKAGVIGLGHQATEDHVPAIKNLRNVELVGAVDNDQQKLKKFIKENKEIKGYSNFDNLIKKHKLDFVIITLPHHLHYKVVKKAIENKIHVLKEKPFAISLEEGKELKQLAEKNSVEVMVTLQRRFNPIYSTFFQLIDKIGKPFFIEIKYTFYTDKPYDGWRGEKKLSGGGCLIDMGYHMVDLLMWYFGLPDRVFCELSTSAIENIDYTAEDTAQTTFRYDKKDLWGNLLVSRVIPPKQEYFNIYGTKGIIHIERGKIERYASNGELKESLEREKSWPSAAQDQIEYFIKIIEGKKENISSPEFHLNHLSFIEASYRSVKDKKYVDTYKFL